MQLVDWLRETKTQVAMVLTSISAKRRTKRSVPVDTLELLESRTLLTYVASFDAGTGALVLTGDSGNDELHLSVGLKGGVLSLSHGSNELSGTPVDSFDFGDGSLSASAVNIPIANLQSIVINGDAGDDTVTLDFSNGVFLPTGGIHFDGSLAGNDVLLTLGGTFASGAVRATGVGSGTIQYHEVANDTLGTITFAGLEPIVDDNIVTDYLITGTATDDVMTISNSAGLRTIVSEATSKFESVAFKNKKNVIVDGSGGADSITLADNSIPADQLESLTVKPGIDPGDAITLAGPLTFPNGTLTLEAPTITQTGGAVALKTLNVTGNTHQIAGSLAVSGTTTLDGGGTDNILLEQPANDFGAVLINGGDAVALFDSNDVIIGNLASTGPLDIAAVGSITQNGTVTNVTDLNYSAGTLIAINADNITSTGSQSYTGAVTVGISTSLTASGLVLFKNDVTLNANLTVDSGAGDVTFQATVNGLAELNVKSAGTTTFAGAVGTVAPLTGLTTDQNGTTVISGGAITSSGVQTYNDPVTVNGATVLATANGNILFENSVTLNGNLTVNSGGGDVSFNGEVDGSAALVVNSSGLTKFALAVGALAPLASLTTDAGGTTDLNGGKILTAGLQTYNDAVVLSADTTLTAPKVTFTGMVDGNGFFLKIVGNAIFGDEAADTVTSLSNLNVTETTLINTNTVTTIGTQTYVGEVTIGTASKLTTTDGAVLFGGIVTLNGNLTVQSGTGKVTFTKTVDGAAALSVDALGDTTFQGAVGSVAALASVATNGGGATIINGGAFKTTGAQNYDDTVTIGTVDLVLTSTASGPVQFGGNLTLDKNLTVTSGSGAVTFNSTVNGAAALVVNSSGATTFVGAVGSAAPLTNLTTNAGGTTLIQGGSIVTTGTQTYGDAVLAGPAVTTLATTNSKVLFGDSLTLIGDLDVTSGAGDVTFTGAVNGGAALKVNSSGTTKFSGVVGAGVALGSIETLGGGATLINGGVVTTTGTQKYGDSVTIGPVNTKLNTTNSEILFVEEVVLNGNLVASTGTGNVTFGKLVNGAADLTVDSQGLTLFAGAVGAITELSSVTTDAGGTTDLNGGQVLTDRLQTYNDAVVLSADTTLTAPQVTFNGTVDGSGFFLHIVGNTIFGDEAADTVTSLSNLNVTETTLINTNTVTTIGTQTYVGNVTIGTDSRLTTTNSTVLFGGIVTLNRNLTVTSGDGNVTFTSTIDGFKSLDVNSRGLTTFGGPVGTLKALTSITTDTGGATGINGGEVHTTGNQTYGDDAVTLSRDAFITTTNGGANVTFQGTLDTSAAAAPGKGNLKLNVAGTTRFASLVGSASPNGGFGSGVGTAILVNRGDVHFEQEVKLRGSLQIEVPSGVVQVTGVATASPSTKLILVSSAPAATPPNGTPAILIQNSTEVVVSDLVVLNMLTVGDGIKADQLAKLTLTSVDASGNQGSGLEASNLSAMSILDSHFDQNLNYGIDLTQGSVGGQISRSTFNSNIQDGIHLTNTVGLLIGGVGTSSGHPVSDGNTISLNGRDGIRIETSGVGNSIRNSILSNDIFGNGTMINTPLQKGIGINLVGGDELTTGMTLNDKDLVNIQESNFVNNTSDQDSGPNSLQNYPEISYMYSDGTYLQIFYSVPTLDPAAYNSDKLDIQFFVANHVQDSTDSSDDWRQGRVFLSLPDGVAYQLNYAGATQQAQIPLTLLQNELGLTATALNDFITNDGLRIVATATGKDGTSEFSRAAAVNARPGFDIVPLPITPTEPRSDYLGAAGFLFAPGPKTPVEHEVPEFEFHWATDGDNSKDIVAGNAATYFNDEFGIYSVDNSAGAVDGVSPSLGSGYIAKVGDEVDGLDPTAIRINFSAHLIESIAATTSDTQLRLDVQIEELSALPEAARPTPIQLRLLLEQILKGPNPSQLSNRTTLLISQEEMVVDPANVTVTNVLLNPNDPNSGFSRTDFTVALTVNRGVHVVNGTTIDYANGTNVVAHNVIAGTGGLFNNVLIVRGTTNLSVSDPSTGNGNRVGFYLVQQGSYQSLLDNNPQNLPYNPPDFPSEPFPDPPPQAFFSFADANRDGQNHFRTVFGDDGSKDAVTGKFLNENYGVLKIYWSDAFNLGFYGQGIGISPNNISPRGIKDAVITVVDPFVQPLRGPGSIVDIGKAVSPAVSPPPTVNNPNPPSTNESFGLTASTATWVNGVSVSTGVVSRENASTPVIITLTHSGTSSVTAQGYTFGPGEDAIITFGAGEKSVAFTVTDIPRRQTVKINATAPGFNNKSKTIDGPKKRVPREHHIRTPKQH
jgi:hypothetical protein